MGRDLDTLTQLIAPIIILPALVILLLGLVVVWLRQRNLAARLTHLADSLDRLESVEQSVSQSAIRDQRLTTDFQEVRAGNLALGRRLGLLESALAELAQQQPELEQLEPERKLYRRAVRMVELGADLNEIMEECELPRAEAELLINLHQQKQA